MTPNLRKRIVYSTFVTLSLAAVTLSVGALFQGYSWINPGGGNWSIGTNWSPTGTPSAPADTATVPAGGGGFTVNLDTSPTIQSLQFLNSSATLNLNANTLTLTDPMGLVNAGAVRANSGTGTIVGNITNNAGGTLIANQNCVLVLNSPNIANAGNILVNHTGAFDATLRFPADSHIGGLGTIQLNGDTDGDRIETTGAATLFNEAGHTIMGRGAFAALLNNSATVSANVNSGTLHMIEKNVTNTGTLKATGGGILRVSGISINNAGGTILADGGEVNLDSGAFVEGGTLDRTGTSAVRAAGSATLKDLSIAASGAFVVNQNVQATLKGTSLINNGLFMINHTGSFDSSVLVDDDLALNGNGVMWLNGDTTSDFIGTSPGKWLTNGSNHTIRGRGAIPAQLVNNGVVQADVNGWNLDLTTNPKINPGTTRSTSGGNLRILGISFDNTGGMLRNDGGSVQLGSGASVVGGTFFGAITGIGPTTLTNVSIAAGGQYTVNNNTSTSVLGTSLVNNGLILINQAGSFDASMVFSSDVSLTGTGELNINGDTTGDTIDTTGAFTLIQGNLHSITGRGSIKGALNNMGVVNANVNGWTLELMDKDKHNPGVMKATNNGTLRINGIDLDNGGRIEAVGGNVFFSGGARIAGGNISSTGTTFLISDGATTFVNTALDAGSEYRLRQNHTATLEGTFFTNNGRFLVNENGSFDSVVLANSNVTLGGTGHVELNGDTDGDTIDTAGAFTLTNAAGHKIHGRGSIKGKVTNNGRIEADVSSGQLRLLDKPKKNAGIMKALNNGILFIGVPVDNLGGTIEANGGPVHLGTGAAITQGILTGPSNFEGIGAANLADLTIDAGTLYRVFNNTTTTLSGSTVTNNGTIRVNHVASFDANLSIDGDVELLGNGTVEINGDTAGDMVSTTTGSKLTVGPNQKITGRGSLKGEVDNKGTVRADILNWTLILNGEEDGIVNLGLIDQANGGRLDIQDGAKFENKGQVTVPATHLARVLAGNYHQTAGTTTVNGQLQILNGDLFMEGGVLNGTGTVTGDVDNAGGSVEPGASPGTLTIQGTYGQTTGGKLKLEFESPSSADKVVVQGAANLAGTLEIVLLNGYLPAEGQEFEVITATSVTGNYDQLKIDGLPEGMSVDVIVESNKVRLRFTSAALTTLVPTSSSVTGATPNGQLSDLFASDDIKMMLRAAGLVPTSLTVETTAPANPLSYMDMKVETSVANSPQLDQKIEFFDFAASTWVLMDNRTVAGTDIVVRVPAANIARFIETGTRKMRSRVTFTPVSPPSKTRQLNTDQFVWRVR